MTLWQGTMAFDLSQIDAGVRGLPLPLLYATATAIALLALVVLRFISNSLPAKSPPVFEGTPFIGGIMKFVKVWSDSEALNSCQNNIKLSSSCFHRSVRCVFLWLLWRMD